jgi:hypothetical protein
MGGGRGGFWRGRWMDGGVKIVAVTSRTLGRRWRDEIGGKEQITNVGTKGQRKAGKHAVTRKKDIIVELNQRTGIHREMHRGSRSFRFVRQIHQYHKSIRTLACLRRKSMFKMLSHQKLKRNGHLRQNHLFLLLYQLLLKHGHLPQSPSFLQLHLVLAPSHHPIHPT